MEYAALVDMAKQIDANKDNAYELIMQLLNEFKKVSNVMV